MGACSVSRDLVIGRLSCGMCARRSTVCKFRAVINNATAPHIHRAKGGIKVGSRRVNLFDGLRRLLQFGHSSVPAQGERTPDPTVGDPPDSADGARHLELCQNAIQCCERGELDAAVRLLQEAIKLRHDFAEAHFVLGQIYQRRGQLDDASDCYMLATHFRADLQEAYLKLGLLALDQSRFEEAQCHLEKAIALKADDAEAHNGMGVALLNRGRAEKAVDHFRRALAVRPEFARAHSNLGHVLFRDFEQFEEGAEHIKTALQLAPEDTDVQSNWTMILEHQGRYAEALALCNRLIERDPDLNEARLNRALILLKMGEFQSAWPDYEARMKVRGSDMPMHLPWPQWNGSSLAGKTFYVHGEQGIGDEIMFASCFSDVISQARACIIECNPKLEKLYRRSFPGASVISKATSGGPVLPEEEPTVDYHAAAGSLPRFLRNGMADFPQHRGYLWGDAQRIAYWRGRLDELSGRLKVGISWRGGAKSTRQSLRSIPLHLWLPILNVAGADFINLQYSDCEDEIAVLRRERAVDLHHWREAIEDYDETAALVSALDLVISVQTAVVHLTGALGKPGWVMVPAVPEWRYQLSGEALPWYPSLRLFRQRTLGQWHEVIDRVAAELTKNARNS